VRSSGESRWVTGQARWFPKGGTHVRRASLLAWFLILASVSGCGLLSGRRSLRGFSGRSIAYDGAVAPSAPEARFGALPGVEAEAAPLLAVVESRKVVYTAQLGIVVRDIRKAIDTTQRLAERMGGHMQRIAGSGIVIRVPADQFDDAIGELEKLGPMPRRDIRAQDVTDQHVDLELRLANAHRLRDKLAALLDKAEKIEDILAVEKELARVTTEIERLEGQLKKLRNQIALATISVGFTRQEHSPSQVRAKLPFHWLRSLGVENLLNMY
jgi:uncharacterized protein DUF4349